MTTLLPHDKVAKACNAISVEDALKLMNPTSNLMTVLAVEAEANVWANFGKLNSHLLRSILINIMNNAKLSDEGRFMVYFFCAAIKDQQRILRSMDNLPSTITGLAWFGPVKKFFTTSLVKYVSQERAGKFATVHLPGTNPGLDIYCAMIQTPKANLHIDTILTRQTAAQLWLDPSLQTKNRAHMEVLWNDIITKSNNPDKTRYKKGFQADYYANQAGDQYLLVNPDFTELVPGDQNQGYSEAELENYVDEWKSTKNSWLP